MSQADGGAPFKPLTLLALIAAAVFAFAAIGVLGAFAPELRRGDDGRAHALSRSAIGYAATVQMLRGLDRPVLLSRGRTGLRDDAVLILTPVPGAAASEIDALWSDHAQVVVVLPKWMAGPDPRRKGWVQGLVRIPAQQSLSVLPEEIREDLRLAEGGEGRSLEVRSAGQTVSRVPVERPRTLAGEGWRPVIVDGAGRALLAYHEATGLYVLADPDLLNTRDFDQPAKARAALAVVQAVATGDAPVVFDLTLAGLGRPRDVVRLLLEPPLLGFTLCLLAAVLLVGWQAAIRFAPYGQADRTVALGKKALADNTAALVRLARRERGMARPYAELVRREAAKGVAAPHGLNDEALTTLLDRLAARQGSDKTYAALAAEADRVRTAGDLMTVARALNRWKSEMTRERG